MNRKRRGTMVKGLIALYLVKKGRLEVLIGTLSTGKATRVRVMIVQGAPGI